MSEFDDLDDWKEPTPEEIKKEAIKFFRDRHESDGKSGFQYRPILNAVIQKAVKKAEAEDNDFKNLESYLWTAEEVIENITSALNIWWKDPPEGMFWYGFADDHLLEKPKDWTDDSPISQDNLDAAAAKYFKEPWLQCNELDWYILSGFIMDELLRFAEGIRSGAVYGKINWAYAFSGGSYLKMVMMRPVLAFIGFVVRWVLLPGIALGLLYFGYDTASYWVLGAFAVYVFFRLVFVPKSIMRWRERRKAKIKIDKIYTDLNQIRRMTANSTLNPTQIKNRIVEAEKEHTLFRSAVHSVLDRMIGRDPAVFTRDS